MRAKLSRQFNRVFISVKDVEKSIAYFSAAERASKIEDWDAVGGLISAGIVAYARPFSGNEPNEHVVANPPFAVSELSESEQILHAKLIDLRNRVIAHSDAEMNPARAVEHRETGFLVKSRLYNPILEHHELPGYLELAKTASLILERKLFELNRIISSHENGVERSNNSLNSDGPDGPP